MRATSGDIELRLPTPADAAGLFELAREEELTRFLQWPAHRSLADSHAYIADTARLWERRAAFMPCIFRTADGELLGAIGLSHIDRANHRAEVGTWLGVRHQRRGYNRPAKAAMFALAFEVLGLNRLELLVRTDNTRSRAAAEALPGVHYEGTARQRLWSRGHAFDADVFALIRNDWEPTDYPGVDVDAALA